MRVADQGATSHFITDLRRQGCRASGLWVEGYGIVAHLGIMYDFLDISRSGQIGRGSAESQSATQRADG